MDRMDHTHHSSFCIPRCVCLSPGDVLARITRLESKVLTGCLGQRYLYFQARLKLILSRSTTTQRPTCSPLRYHGARYPGPGRLPRPPLHSSIQLPLRLRLHLQAHICARSPPARRVFRIHGPRRDSLHTHHPSLLHPDAQTHRHPSPRPRAPPLARHVHCAAPPHLPLLARLDKLPAHIDILRSGGVLLLWRRAECNVRFQLPVHY